MTADNAANIVIDVAKLSPVVVAALDVYFATHRQHDARHLAHVIVARSQVLDVEHRLVHVVADEIDGQVSALELRPALGERASFVLVLQDLGELFDAEAQARLAEQVAVFVVDHVDLAPLDRALELQRGVQLARDFVDTHQDVVDGGIHVELVVVAVAVHLELAVVEQLDEQLLLPVDDDDRDARRHVPDGVGRLLLAFQLALDAYVRVLLGRVGSLDADHAVVALEVFCEQFQVEFRGLGVEAATARPKPDDSGSRRQTLSVFRHQDVVAPVVSENALLDSLLEQLKETNRLALY
jgi:hypothetical protein